MKFTAALATLAVGALSQLAPAAHEARDVWTPQMTYPASGTVWESGKTYTVRWETKDAPVNITGADSGFITLRSGDYETPVILAYDIHLRDGHASVKAPDVFTADDYSLVLFGDSGNWGPQFTIKGPVN
ncbi:hypothetical protein PsYK624_130840 [Phanerochaete sordida]|uniref:Yeast cell wall synthesis Kre9/Knh1-like N-terminal domain-containing protein n=1 Tax=Phanerochaete sordida TaxID=48140 RepID=A0A9P3GKX2_9APHY|nr:hypothetical protein PsYK624_130840 [Phanerochaete sordida]